MPLPTPLGAVTVFLRVYAVFLLDLLDERRSGYSECADFMQKQRFQLERMLSSCSLHVGMLLNEDQREYLHTYMRGLQFEARQQGFDTTKSVQNSAAGRAAFENGRIKSGFDSYCEAYDGLVVKRCNDGRIGGRCRRR